MNDYSLKSQINLLKSLCDNLLDNFTRRLTDVNQQLLQFELIIKIVIDQQIIDLVWLNQQWLKLYLLIIEQQNLLIILQQIIEHNSML
jgi:hypothetical protein